MDSILSAIERQYAAFSKGQRRIADFLLASYDDAAFMTAAKLGVACGVSESTVVRFAYALELDGYPALQAALGELVRHRLTSVQRIRLAENIPETDVLRTVLTADMANLRSSLELIDNAAFSGAIASLLSARRVYVLGVGSAQPLAQFLFYYLNYVFDNLVLLGGSMQDIHERLLRVGEGDVCFGISFPRYSSRTAEAMRYAKSQGAKLIALTDLPSSPLAAEADFTLLAKSDMASFADSLVAPLSFLNAIIVAVGLARKEDAFRHLTRLEQIWRSEGAYVREPDSEPSAPPLPERKSRPGKKA